MANKHRGEIGFEAGDKSYTFRFSTNAICEVESVLDRSIISISQDMVNAEKNPEVLRFSTVRAILWAGLREHHPKLTLTEAGDVMTEMGGLSKAVELIADGFSLSFPEPQTNNGADRPQKPSRPAKAGIGLAS
jgi:hypothetical protein